MTIKELIKLIEQWAIDRGLDKNGTVEGQLIKTAEEVAELIIAISKNNVKDIKDAIGDVFVTLVVGNLLSGCWESDKMSDFTLQLSHRKKDLTPGDKFRLFKVLSADLKELMFERDSFWIKEGYSTGAVGQTICTLFWVSNYYKLNLTDCVESAYNEIAGRKGRVIDGTFVKEDDLV